MYLGFKYERRRSFIRQLFIDRITPEELKSKLDSGEEVVIVDLRGSLDFEAEPETIPGARWMKAAISGSGCRIRLYPAPTAP